MKTHYVGRHIEYNMKTTHLLFKMAPGDINGRISSTEGYTLSYMFIVNHFNI